MFNIDLDGEDMDEVEIAWYAILLHQPPSVIRKESYKDLTWCGIIKEFEAKKQKKDMEDSKRKSKGKSVIR